MQFVTCNKSSLFASKLKISKKTRKQQIYLWTKKLQEKPSFTIFLIFWNQRTPCSIISQKEIYGTNYLWKVVWPS